VYGFEQAVLWSLGPTPVLLGGSMSGAMGVNDRDEAADTTTRLRPSCVLGTGRNGDASGIRQRLGL